jgi:hypothetical protein
MILSQSSESLTEPFRCCSKRLRHRSNLIDGIATRCTAVVEPTKRKNFTLFTGQDAKDSRLIDAVVDSVLSGFTDALWQ